MGMAFEVQDHAGLLLGTLLVVCLERSVMHFLAEPVRKGILRRCILMRHWWAYLLHVYDGVFPMLHSLSGKERLCR